MKKLKMKMSFNKYCQIQFLAYKEKAAKEPTKVAMDENEYWLDMKDHLKVGYKKLLKDGRKQGTI